MKLLFKATVFGCVSVAVMATSSAHNCAKHGEEKAEAAPTEKVEEKKADVSVTITGNDTLQFDKKAFEVVEGQTVEIVFKNVGNIPVDKGGHNLVVLKAGADVSAFAMKGMQAKDDGYVPTDEESKKLVVAATKILGPGEEEKVTFMAGEAGEYPFVCTFPGHFAIMKGVMTVKAK